MAVLRPFLANCIEIFQITEFQSHFEVCNGSSYVVGSKFMTQMQNTKKNTTKIFFLQNREISKQQWKYLCFKPIKIYTG